MKGKEFEELVADIKRRGLRVPITVISRPIPRADGPSMMTFCISCTDRNRERACAEAGVIPEYVEFDGDAEDIPRFIISANIHRRHLTSDDRHKYLKLLIEWDPSKSNRTLAAEIGVSEPTVRRARPPASRDAPATKRVGRDGKAYPMPTKKARASTGSPQQRWPALLPPRELQPVSGPAVCEEVTAEEAREAGAIAMQDVGPGSAAEAARLQARIDELQCQKRQLESKVPGLESEIEALRAVITDAPIEQLLEMQERRIPDENKAARQCMRALKKSLEELPSAIEGECVRVVH